MVQLHVTEESIKRKLDKMKKEFSECAFFIDDFYYDLTSDPTITSLATIKTHLDKLTIFLRWIRKNNINITRIDDNIIKRYIIYLRLERRVKSETLYTYIRVLKRILRVLGYNELAEKLKYPKRRIVAPELPSPELVERIISSLRDPFKTVVALIYETGARVSEILSLKYKHIKETQYGYYRIIIEDSKNGEFRTVYVIKYAMLLRNYLLLHPGDPEEIVFKSPVYPKKPLKPWNVEAALRTAAKKYGVRIYPHLLRHLRATLLIKEKMPERIVMKILGHRTEKMLRIYVNLAQQDVEETILKHYGIHLPVQNNDNRTIKCIKCGAINVRGANYCWRCGYPLHQQAAIELDKKKQEVMKKINEIIKIINENPDILRKILSGKNLPNL